MALDVASLSSKLQAVLASLSAVRSTTADARAQAAASTLNVETVRQLLTRLRNMRTILASIPRTQRLADKAVEELGYTGGTIGADIAAIETALNNLGNEIASRANTLWNSYAINASTWVETIPTWNSGQTANFQTLAQALVTAIDAFASKITDQ